MKRKEYRDRVAVTISAEKDRWQDFQDLCDRERKSASLKITEMVEKELQKNAVGERREPDPLHIRMYISAADKPSQSDIRQWLPRDEAIKMARHVALDSKQWYFIGDTCHIIGRKKATGYL